MANEVKDLVSLLVKNSGKEEISVDEVFTTYADLDPERNRVDVLSALRALEVEGFGVLAVGRRGHATRFIKGATRIKPNIDQAKLDAIKTIIDNLQEGQAAVVLKTGDLIIHENHVVFHDNNRNHLIECLKIFEENGLGRFIIGRRGGQSRFVKGTTARVENEPPKIELPVTTIEPVITIKYNVINNILFKTTHGFNTVEEALQNEAISIEDPSILKEELEKFGYVKLS